MAIVSNVWFNLTAWAAGTFTTGQLRSSSSNVYVCTNGGSGTIAPVGTGSSINGGGGVTWSFVSTYDFGDLTSWSTSIPGTPTQAYIALVGVGVAGAIQTPPGQPFVTLSGHATTPTNSITITAFPGQGFAPVLAGNPALALAFSTTGGVAFQLPATTAPANYFNFIDDNVILSGIQIQDPNSSSGSTIISSAANLLISNCIIDGYPQTTADMFDFGNAGTGTTTIVNSVIIDRSPNDANFRALIKVRNNLVMSCTSALGVNTPANTAAIFNAGGASYTNTVIDSIIAGYAAGFTLGSNSGGTSAISYTVVSAASITSSGVTAGSGMQYSKTAASQFVSATSTPNLRLLGTATAISGGTPDTTNNPSSVDILGTHRPIGSGWDAGAYEAGSTSSFGTASGHATVSGTVATVIRVSGAADGRATVSGAMNAPTRTGTASGQATAIGVVAAVATAFGTADGRANVNGFPTSGVLGAIITINPIPPQPPNTAFTVTGTYTIYPALQFSDDNTNSFSPIAAANITPLGTQVWSFLHTGELTPGPYQLIIYDASTNTSVATTYVIVASIPGNQVGSVGSSLFPPTSPTGLSTIIPSYLYQEYADDDNLQAFVQAQNTLAQTYLTYVNALNLPIYTRLSGPLLNWVAEGLYGMIRPNLSSSTSNAIGPFNTYPYNTLALATGAGTGTTTFFNVTDDLFKRMITWNFYKGDGFTFNTSWLKRRVMRFLGGTDGIDYGVSETYQVSVQFVGATTINITVHAGSQPTTYVPILAAAINANVCQLPFMYTYNILQS